MQFKQKTLHQAAAIFARLALSGALWISCIALPFQSEAQERQDTQGNTSLGTTLGDQAATLRLIAAPSLSNGRYSAGIDIAMQPGAHTYWKQPGDAGVPPVFSFNGSQNVADAHVEYPTPVRISEDTLDAFGYLDRVVFPILVTPQDPSRPAILQLDATYAVCRKICVPGHATTTLHLPASGPAADGAIVQAALDSVPIQVPPALRRNLTIASVKGAPKPSWTLTWSGSSPVTDVFADAPEGFYFETKKTGPDRFLLTAAQVVSATKTTSVPVTLVIAVAPRAVVVHETLDVAGTTN